MSLKLIPPGKRKGYRTWYLRGTVDGRRLEINTETADAAAAREFRKRFERRLAREPEAGERRAATFAEAADRYLAWRAPRRRDERDIRRMMRDEVGRVLCDDVTTAVLVEAAERLCPALTNETKNRNVFTPAAAILHYAAANNLCAYRRIQKLREKRPEPRAIDPALAEVAIRAARGPMRLLLTWLFRQGTRITDTLGVQRENIDRRAGTVRLRIGKTDEWILMPLHDDVAKLLPAKLGRGGLFPWTSRSSVYRPLRALLKPLGFRFTPHQGRHTFATTLVNMGESLDPLPHWKDPKSRARYGRPALDLQRQIMGRLGATRGRGRKEKRNQR